MSAVPPCLGTAPQHQVVGRVSKGLDVLQLLADVPCGPDDSPLMRLKVAKCGATNAQVRVCVCACVRACVRVCACV
jgi:hypothetical protein